MAGGTSDVIVKFGADLTELSQGFKKAQTDAEASSGGIGKSFATMGPMATQAGTAMTAGITVPILAIAAFSMKAASDVGGAWRTIARETGLMGAPLESVKESFKTVFSSVPQDAQAVASSISLVVQRLHLMGDALVKVTTNIGLFSTMSGTDMKANTDSFTSSMVSWNSTASESVLRSDQMTVAWQKTGVSQTELNDVMAKAAPIAKGVGMSYEDTLTIMGSMTEAGLPAKQSLSMLNKIAVESGAAGKTAGAGFKEMVDRFKQGKESKEDIDLLGSAVVKFREEAKGGLLDGDKWSNDLKKASGATQDLYSRTASFGDNMKTIMNKLEIAMQPLGSAIYDAFKSIMPLLTPLIGFIASITSAFSTLPGPIKMVIIVIAGIAAALGPIILFLPTIAAAVPIIMAIAAAAGAILIPLLPIIVAVVAIGAAFYLLYTYVKPFHDAVDSAFQVIKQMADLLMKGDFGGAFNLLATSLKNIDWGGILNGISNWFNSQDWGAIGRQVGTLVGRALVFAFQAAVDLASWFASAFASLISTGGAKTAGGEMGTQAKGSFLDIFGGVASGIQTQLSRIHINWDVIFGDIGGIFADVGAVAGAAMAVALIGAIQPLLSVFGIHIVTDGLIDKAMGNLKNDLNKYAGDLKTNIAVTGDLTDFNTQITAATAAHHETLITAKAITEVANSDLSVFAKTTRIADIIAAAKTDIAASSLDTVTKQQRIAEINAIANTIDANGNLNDTARQRLAEIVAQANPGDAAAILNALAAPRTVYYQAVVLPPASGAAGVYSAQYIPPGNAEGGIVKAAHGLITQGPTLVMAGEAGDEAFIPLKGGKVPVSINVSGGSTMSIPSVGGRLSDSTSSSTVQYNAYVTVDSENVTRKVFEAFRTLEQYQQLR